VNTQFSFHTDRQISSGFDTNNVRGQLRIDGAGYNIVNTDFGTPVGSDSFSFSSGVLTLNAGQAVTLTNWLYVDGYVDPNGLWTESPGWATLDASYRVTVTVIGGAIGTASGHDYSPSAVPEPASWALLLGGAALLVLRRRGA
jgi:hypothetical protein